jgi:hypothetical protein
MRSREQRTCTLIALSTPARSGRRSPARRAAPAAASISLSILAALSAGCALPLGNLPTEIPRQAASGAVGGATAALDDPATRARIERILASPEVRGAERAVLSGIIDGLVATLDDPQRADRIEMLGSRAFQRILEDAARGLPPVAGSLTRSVAGGALDAALDPARRGELSDSVGAVVGSTVRAATTALSSADIAQNVSRSMTESIGPALGETVRKDIGPGLAAVLNDAEFQRALGATARTLGREIVLGATDALAEKKPPPESGSPLARATGLAREGARLFGSAAWLLLLVIVALVVWVWKLVAQSRRYREEADRRTATARLLEDAARVSEGKPWAGELLHALEERATAEQRIADGLRPRRPAKRGRRGDQRRAE